LSVKISAGLCFLYLSSAGDAIPFASIIGLPILGHKRGLDLLCGSETEATENKTVTAFDPSIIYGGSWKTNGSHGISHKNSKSGGAFANYTFQGSAIYYTGEISSKVSAVEVIIDAVSYGVLNISHQAHVKGMKTAASDVEILFSATDLDSKDIHTFTLKDYEEQGNKSEKFITLYRLTVTTGSSDSSSETLNQATETGTPKVYGMEMSSGEAKSRKNTAIGVTLGILFGVVAVFTAGILIFRRRRRDFYKQSILQTATPFIVQSYLWRVVAGERLPKLVTPVTKRRDPASGIVNARVQQGETARPSAAETTTIETETATHDPPPEYIV